MTLRNIVLSTLAAVLLLPCPTNAQPSMQTEEIILRELLATHPNHDKARERLVLLLLQSDRRGAAAFHAKYLSKKAGSAALREQAQRLSYRLDGPTWGWHPILSVTPSSNLNKASTQESILVGDTPFSIDEDSRAVDGIGLTFGLGAWRTWRPNEVWRGHISGEISGTVYDTDDLEPQQFIRTKLAFSRMFGKHAMTLGLSADATAERGDLTRYRFGPFVTGKWNVSEDRQFSAHLSIQDVNYTDEEFRNGLTNSLWLGWSERLSPTLRFRIGVPLKTVRTKRAHLDYDGIGVGVTLDKSWQNGKLLTSFGLDHANNDYNGIFPGSTQPRNDKITTISVEIANSELDFMGFMPRLRYEYSRSKSNVALYDFESSDVLIRFEKAF